MAQTMIISSALTCKPFVPAPAARTSRNGAGFGIAEGLQADVAIAHFESCHFVW